MPTSTNGHNALCELARVLLASGRQSTAVALRRLAQEGYTTLEQVDSVSDWVLLSIRGIGVGRLGELRRLTQPDWEPPSPQAIHAGNGFQSAAMFALRYWSPEELASLIHGSSPTQALGGPVEKQLAMDVLVQAIRRALRYLQAEELAQALFQARNSYPGSTQSTGECASSCGARPQAEDRRLVEPPTADLLATSLGECYSAKDNDHFAHPRHKRKEIVRRYWIAREKRQIKNKDAWARSRYQISGKTLLCYEREFNDHRQAILAAAGSE